MSAYQPPPTGPPAQDPGRTMGIVGLILAIFCSLIGLIVSAIAYNTSKKAGYQNNFALAGIIVGIVSLVLGVVINFTIGFPFMNRG
jgi:presenilin-like A22 family membrane protease